MFKNSEKTRNPKNAWKHGYWEKRRERQPLVQNKGKGLKGQLYLEGRVKKIAAKRSNGRKNCCEGEETSENRPRIGTRKNGRQAGRAREKVAEFLRKSSQNTFRKKKKAKDGIGKNVARKPRLSEGQNRRKQKTSLS